MENADWKMNGANGSAGKTTGAGDEKRSGQYEIFIRGRVCFSSRALWSVISQCCIFHR